MDNRFAEGYLGISANGHYFTDGNGDPFFWMGDTSWPLFCSFNPEDAEIYLENRRSKGFTVIQCVLGWTGGTGDTLTFMTNLYGEVPWINEDVSDPNEEYFKNVDRIVEIAEAKGLILGILPIWGVFADRYPRIDEKSAYEYGIWLGERYKDSRNIIWLNGGDCMTWNKPIWDSLGRGLKAGSNGKHLITFHPGGEFGISSNIFHSRSWLDFNMVQTWSNHSGVYPFVRTDYGNMPPKPIVLGEGAYEDGPEYHTGPITPYIIRKQAYWTFMAGGFHTYGNNFMWRPDSPWKDHLDSPGAEQMSVFRKIITSREWWKFVPEQSVFIWGMNGGDTLNAAVRSVDGDCIIAYISSKTSFTLNLKYLSNSSNVTVTWFNPATGEKLEADSCSNTAEAAFTTPAGWEDAVLILDGIS